MKCAFSILIIFFTFLNTGCSTTSDSSSMPNVLIIYPDQFRRYSAGFWSTPEYQGKTVGNPDPVYTPHIDKLAQNGIVFTNGISNYPLCSPSRGMLLSGMYPEQNGIWNNCRQDRKDALKKGVSTLTDVFYNAGYNVSYFGKCHWIQAMPHFDEAGKYVGTSDYPGGNHINRYDTYVPPGPDRHSIEYFYQSVVDSHVDPLAYSNDPITVGGKADGEPYRPKEFTPKTESRYIREYIKNSRNQRDTNKPFFIFWSPNPPHAPWDKKNTDMVEYNRYYSEEKVAKMSDLLIRDNVDSTYANHTRTYFANVSSIDKYIGKIIEELENTGVLDNTIILFSSDHGEMLGSHSLAGKNVIQTESVAVPLIIHWPNGLKHKINESFVNVPDLMPTLLGLAGLEDLIPEGVEGNNLSMNLEDKMEAKLTTAQSSLILLPEARGLINERYTLKVADLGDNNNDIFLYDNKNDPYQLQKIKVAERRSVANDMLKELGRLLAKTNDPWFQQRKFDQIITY